MYFPVPQIVNVILSQTLGKELIHYNIYMELIFYQFQINDCY